MIDLIFILVLILGACAGSFVCCQIRRQGKKQKDKWSRCEHCKKKLKWYDKIPIVSWVLLRGRCRYCKKKIGNLEIICEVGGALAFCTLFLFWPIELGGMRGVADGEVGAVLLFLLASIFITVLGWLVVLDIAEKEVPQKLLQMLILVGAIFWIMREVIYGGQPGADILSLSGGILILGGVYYVLYKVSKEKWVGGAEWMVGLAMACVLAKWELSLICLILSNVAGVLIVVSLNIFLNKKIKLIPMLPFLALGFLLTLSIFFDFYVG